VKIEIDEQTYEYLQANARPFEDTPASVLRRLLGLDSQLALTERPTPARRNTGAGLDDPKRYLPGRIVTISGPRLSRPIESGVRNDRGADLNQVQTDLARLTFSRNPATSRALENLRHGSRREQVGDYVVTVRDRSPARPRLLGSVPSIGEGPTLEDFKAVRREMWKRLEDEE
jgi:hypothetical protein